MVPKKASDVPSSGDQLWAYLNKTLANKPFTAAAWRVVIQAGLEDCVELFQMAVERAQEKETAAAEAANAREPARSACPHRDDGCKSDYGDRRSSLNSPSFCRQAQRRANRRCAALSRSVQRPKGARLSAMLEILLLGCVDEVIEIATVCSPFFSQCR